jgi:hypothetical protein
MKDTHIARPVVSASAAGDGDDGSFLPPHPTSWRFSGLPAGLRPTEPGVLRGRLTWVVMKIGGEWQIVSQQITPIPPQQ